MANDPIETSPTPPPAPEPQEWTAEQLNKAVNGYGFSKFMEQEGGIGVAFTSFDVEKRVLISGVNPTDIAVE